MDLEISNQQINLEMRNASAPVSKLYVVASNKLIQATNSLMHHFIASYFELILLRIPMMQRRNKIEMLRGLIQKIDQDQERLVEYMRQINMAGNVQAQAMDFINRSFQSSQNRRAELIAQQQALSKEQDQAVLPFFENCIEKLTTFSDFLPQVLLAAREELELTIDVEAYMLQHKQFVGNVREIMEQFIGEASKHLSP